MRFDKRTVLKGYDGVEELTYSIQESDDNGNFYIAKKPLTILDAVVTAINAQIPNEIKTAEMIAKITGISVKFYQSNEVNLTEDDMVFIKDRVLKATQHNIWMPVVYSSLCLLFDMPQDNTQLDSNDKN